MELIKKIVAIATVLTVSVFVVGPGTAEALTAAELQAQIAALQAQLTQLTDKLAQLQAGQTGAPAACSGVTFDRNLSQGMSGNDVKCLQALLNQSADTQVAASGAGSPGNETSYFGALTKAAVVKFQEKYASEVLTPAGLTAGTGYVGPKTRAKLNALLGTGVVGVVCGNGVCEAGETNASCPADCLAAAAAGLTVKLASDTPAAGTLVSAQSVAPLAKFTFTNGDAAEVKVTQLKLKRLGVSADTTLSNVYLFDGANRLTDSASVSSGVITFTETTGIFAVGANASKTITVVSDIASVSGETVGVGINAASDVVSNASVVNGTFPVNGNIMSIASATLAGVSFAAPTPSSDATVDPQNDYAVWQSITTITTRAVNLTRISLREIGSINYSDLQNFRLYVDGVQVGSAIANLDAAGYVTFDLSAAPKKIETGARTIKVLADILGGSTRTLSFSLRVAADANFVDTQYGVNVGPVAAGSTAFSARTTGTLTVASGTLTVTKTSDSPAGNVVDSAPAVTLAKFELKAAGEKIKIESLTAEVIWTNADSGAGEAVATLRNAMLLANGVQIGSTQSIDVDATTTDNSGTSFSLGSSLIVVPGSPVTLSVVADIYDNDSTNHLESSDTLQVNLLAGSANAQRLTSLSTLGVPGSATTGNSVTIASGTLTLSKYTAYTNQSFVAPVTRAKLAHFTLTTGTTEAVNLSTIVVDFASAYNTGTFDAAADLTDLYVTYGTQTSSTKATVSSADAGNSWAINYTLAAGATVDVVVYANAKVGAGTAGYAQASMTITGTTAQSATTATGGETAGQVVLFTQGSLTSDLASDTPLAQVVSGSTVADILAVTPKTLTAAKFKFVAVSESYTIQEVKVKVGSSTISAVILYAVLKDGSTVLGTKPFDTTDATLGANTVAYFTGLTVSVPANTTKTLTVDLMLSVPSADAGTSQSNAVVTLDWFKALDSQGAIYSTGVGTDRAANNLYVYQSFPTVTQVDLTNSRLSNNSSSEVYKFKVAANSQGPVSLKQLKFALAWNDAGTSQTLTLSNFQFYRGSTDITTSAVTIQNTSGTSVESTTGVTDAADTVVIVTFDTEETIPAGQEYTYSLKAKPTNFTYEQASGYDSFALNLAGDTTAHNSTAVYLVGAGTLGVGNTTVQRLGTAANGSGTNTAYNAIWSDNSAISHVYTSGSSSNDWANGYLILNLPLSTESWEVQ